ncbi:OsmC family protein [Jeotgalibacillus proteolyticus]|uniref:OsmC family protein n=1 Tax=Jeotgalibacillus proteolyticus TaxID=2082395 RepID=UPI003CEF0CEF
MNFTMKENGFTTDLPYGMLDVSGNEEHGYRPYQLLTASIAVCSGGVLRSVLNKMRLSFEDIAIETEVERNEQEANRVEKIHMHFKITGSDLDEKKVHKAMELTRKNCSMVQSVLGSIEITETFEIN